MLFFWNFPESLAKEAGALSSPSALLLSRAERRGGGGRLKALSPQALSASGRPVGGAPGSSGTGTIGPPGERETCAAGAARSPHPPSLPLSRGRAARARSWRSGRLRR